MTFKTMAAIGLLAGALCNSAYARPVSYPGGWTSMISNNGSNNAVHIHYSPTANYSLGVRSQYNRDKEFWFNGVQVNNLIKRWNEPDSQANFYLKSGAGVTRSDYGDYDGKTAGTFFTGIALDWEDRRFFTSYENTYFDAGDIDDHYAQSARVGVAPYIGDYGDLHTWMMVLLDHEPEAEHPVTVTPLVRMFKDVHLVEAGLSNRGEVTLNWVIRY